MPHARSPTSKSAARSAPDRAQLLGIAFASAELAFEVDSAGKVLFVVGASRQYLGTEGPELVGGPWRKLIDPADAGMVAAVLAGLEPGARRAGLRVRLAAPGPRPVEGELSLFATPAHAGHVSCSFRRLAAVRTRGEGPNGLASARQFESLAAELLEDAAGLGRELHLELLELVGFDTALRQLPPAEAESARAEVADALRAEAVDGQAAAEVARDRYAVVRGQAAGDLLQRLTQASGVQVASASTPMSGMGERLQALRALRFAVDRHILAGPAAAAVELGETLRATLERAADFRAAVSRGRFRLAYQPVVALQDGRLHHFEALVRFDGHDGAESIVAFAEDLDLIEDFDRAVFGQVVETLRQNAGARIAVNLSARSLMAPGLVDSLLASTASAPAIRRRLLVEITETAALSDLDAADRQVQRLRSAGHVVCLDDFGAGAAALDYLRKLTVDVVKIDGRYVRGVEAAPRDRLVLQHLAALCRALDVTVIAEMVEDEAIAEVLRAAQIPLAQGFRFGRPQMSLEWTPASPIASRERRRGSTNEWR